MMTDLPPIQPPVATVKSGASRGMRWLLALSLALNLAVAGFMIGHALDRDGPGGPRGMARDLAFGPFTEALSPQDRRALFKSMLSKAPAMRDARKATEADMALILSSLSAEPFDPAALDGALAAFNTRSSANLSIAQTTLRDFLVDMTPEDRLAFAMRLQERIKGGPKP